tara:strand:+ start:9106 stop:9993 length:888 start_codon:yes stop_codon:yes gene_type:complete
MPKKIIILGSNGQLGRELSIRLSGDNTLAFTKSDCDITNETEINTLLSHYQNSIVINASAYTKVDEAEKEFHKAELVNAKGVGFISSACKKTNSHLVHFSTDYVFDGNASKPYKENDHTSPVNLYGKSKLAGEKVATISMEKLYIFRTSWVYGEYGNNFPKTMLSLLKEKNELKVVDDQIGVPTSTAFLAMVTTKFVKKIILNSPFEYGIYNIVPDGSCSWFDVSNFIFSFLQTNMPKDLKTTRIFPVDSSEFPTLAKRPKYSLLNNTKLKKTINIKPYNWDVYLHEFLKSFTDE